MRKSERDLLLKLLKGDESAAKQAPSKPRQGPQKIQRVPLERENTSSAIMKKTPSKREKFLKMIEKNGRMNMAAKKKAVRKYKKETDLVHDLSGDEN